ncbi:hypothetical protein G5V59_02255 [Nocardioides sp. W3-2-3]|uniref:hypothetical protein n=1 Tax=Nocardioides convexus TaxID=2712224 RepID=UPI00241890FB|nr:hypothetical protein [Nocardioides convexus]NGZ99596.1 hypothetical protein [Nocardioides convexus]
MAAQGRVIEAVVDVSGAWLPSVPVLSVVPDDPADLWRLLAVTLAPPLVAHAAARYLGTGLTPGSVKVSARQARGPAAARRRGRLGRGGRPRPAGAGGRPPRSDRRSCARRAA